MTSDAPKPDWWVCVVLPNGTALRHRIYFINTIQAAFGPYQSTFDIHYLWSDVYAWVTDTVLTAIARTEAGALWLLANAPEWAEVTHAPQHHS